MATTTTTPVAVVSSGMSSLSSVTVAPSLIGLHTTLGQHDVVLPPPLTPRCSGGVLGLVNYAMSSPWLGFFFRVEPPTVLYIICLVSVLVSAFYFQVPCWIPYSPLGHPWGLNHWGLHPCNPLGVYPW